MSFIIEYVVGFAFTAQVMPKGEGRVALIQKQRPEWQAGKLNGIGGHREGNEHLHEAMSREFHEETGVLIQPCFWHKVGKMFYEGKWTCWVFTCVHRDVMFAKTTTDERVRLLTIDQVRFNRDQMLENVPSLIELCKLQVDHTNTIPMFNLDYSRDRKTANPKPQGVIC